MLSCRLFSETDTGIESLLDNIDEGDAVPLALISAQVSPREQALVPARSTRRQWHSWLHPAPTEHRFAICRRPSRCGPHTQSRNRQALVRWNAGLPRCRGWGYADDVFEQWPTARGDASPEVLLREMDGEWADCVGFGRTHVHPHRGTGLHAGSFNIAVSTGILRRRFPVAAKSHWRQQGRWPKSLLRPFPLSSSLLKPKTDDLPGRSSRVSTPSRTSSRTAVRTVRSYLADAARISVA